MQQQDLVKATVLTVDCDFCDFPPLLEEWGQENTAEGRKAVKQALYAMSEMEVISLMGQMGFITKAVNALCSKGLPVRPNRVLYTGHGLCVQYWLSEDVGYNDESEWNVNRLKAILKRFIDHHQTWAIDPGAKDIGTRLFPVAGHMHRSADKRITYLSQKAYNTDEIADWAAIFQTWDDTLPGAKTLRAKRAKGSKGKSSGQSAHFAYKRWNTAWGDYPEEGTRPSPCPSCSGSGFRRDHGHPATCWSCMSKWEAPAPQSGNEVRIDPVTGWAIWPDEITEAEIWKTRTGTGKTHRFKKVISDWKSDDRWSKKVLVISPTIALSKSLSTRLGIRHAEAGGKFTLTSGSIVTCLAGLARTAKATSTWDAESVLVILDEAEAMQQQFLSMLGKKRGREVYDTLKFWLAHAGKVILADAHAGFAVADLAKQADVLRQQYNKPARDWKPLVSAPHRFSLREVQPVTHRSKSGREYVKATSEAVHQSMIMEAIEKGQKIAVGCASKATATALEAEIKDRFPKKNVVAVVGSEHDEDQQDLSPQRLLADVLVYTTAMGSGVSIDAREHYYQRHVILGRSCPIDGNAVEQMIHRVRHPVNAEIIISGGQGDPVTGDRTKPAYYQKIAKARVEADERNLKKWDGEATYSSEWRISRESEVFGDFQCVLDAARHYNGYRWCMEYLRTRHNVTGIGGSGDPSDAKDVKESIMTRKQQEKWNRACAIAAAPSLDEDRYEEISQHGSTKKNEQEAISYRATVNERVYGDAWTKADLDKKKKMAFNSEYKRGIERNTLYAAAVCVMAGKDHVDAVYTADKKRNDSRTYYEHKSPIRKAKAVAAALRAIAMIATLKDGSYHVTNDVAGSVLKDARDAIKAAGLGKGSGAAPAQNIRALSDILRLAGIILRVHKRKVNKKVVRDYYLDVAHLSELRRLADAQIERWLNPPEPVDTESFKYKYGRKGPHSHFKSSFR
ncbi:MAG: hypothetical protein NWE79_02465 [Candidatus Bathyarchaeota archaeon]|nr:hypothetical protein [Candidatus Bathyarchaeota archaeon]